MGLPARRGPGRGASGAAQTLSIRNCQAGPPFERRMLPLAFLRDATPRIPGTRFSSRCCSLSSIGRKYSSSRDHKIFLVAVCDAKKIVDRPRSFQTIRGAASAVQPEERIDRTNLRYHDHGMMRVGWRRGSDADRTQFLIAVRFIAVCFSCDELINSIGLSGLHPTLQVPARPEPEGPT